MMTNSIKLVNLLRTSSGLTTFSRGLSTTFVNCESFKCKVLVVGGGTGGCSVGAKATSTLGRDKVIILEPSDRHYYQPMFTLIGSGMTSFKDSYRSTRSVLPRNAKWIQDAAVEYDPNNNVVYTSKGHKIEYDFMLIAVGMQLNYGKIPGLLDALEIPNGAVCSTYSPKYVKRVYTAMQVFDGGNAIFTIPQTPVKCPAAPQKIMYLTEHYFRNSGKRSRANVTLNSALPVIFAVKYYAGALWEIIETREINVNLYTNLVEVTGPNTAIFENIVSGNRDVFDFNMLHVVPPMSTPDSLSNNKELVTETGFVNVCKKTLQHIKYENIFTIGDCSSSPNPKTATSVAAQCQIVYKNMLSAMKGEKPKLIFNGYSSCPLLTGFNTCIMAEYDYDFKPLETFPVDQRKERYSMFLMKKMIMPPLYWHLMLNGMWNGPEFYRKLFSFLK